MNSQAFCDVNYSISLSKSFCDLNKNEILVGSTRYNRTKARMCLSYRGQCKLLRKTQPKAVKSSFLLIHHLEWLIEYRRVRVWFRSTTYYLVEQSIGLIFSQRRDFLVTERQTHFLKPRPYRQHRIFLKAFKDRIQSIIRIQLEQFL